MARSNPGINRGKWERVNAARRARAHLTPGAADLTKPERLFMAKLEQQQARGEILWWAEHPFSLRLGTGLRYEPDFAAVVVPELCIEAYEVKGSAGFRLDAKGRTKLRAAANAYPCFRFVAVVQRTRKQGGGFVREVIEPRVGLTV